MKRFVRSQLGVTLLEIMLVLAIASMIIVMSIKYYRSASNAQQTTAALQQVNAVIAAMDSMGMNGGYNAKGVTNANLLAILGTGNTLTPTGGTVALQSQAVTTYTVLFPLSTSTCPAVAAQLQGNAKTASSSCDASGNLTLSYDSTK